LATYINLGDIIIDDGDIFGDGVNIAARLERGPAGGGPARKPILISAGAV
jgi:adenylate cyclase